MKNFITTTVFIITLCGVLITQNNQLYGMHKKFDKALDLIERKLKKSDPFGLFKCKLFAAAKFNHVPALCSVLSSGRNINIRHTDGQTALMWAAKYGSLDVAQELIARGADVNAQDDNGETALMHVFPHSIFDGKNINEAHHLTTLLINAHARTLVCDNKGNNALMWAISGDFSSVIATLISAMMLEFQERGNDVCIAWNSCPIEVINHYIKPFTHPLDTQNEDGLTALMVATAKNNLNAVQLLIEAGATINTQDDEGGTALIYAIFLYNTATHEFIPKKRYNPAIIKLLLKHGADTQIINNKGKTVIQMITDLNEHACSVKKQKLLLSLLTSRSD